MCGQLGHGDTASYKNPKKVAAFEGIPLKQVACGDEFTACLSGQFIGNCPIVAPLSWPSLRSGLLSWPCLRGALLLWPRLRGALLSWPCLKGALFSWPCWRGARSGVGPVGGVPGWGLALLEGCPVGGCTVLGLFCRGLSC